MDNEINIPPMGAASLLGFPAYAGNPAVDVVDVDGPSRFLRRVFDEIHNIGWIKKSTH